MVIEDDGESLLEKIPSSTKCCFCIGIKTGTLLIAILGMLFSFTCCTLFLLRGRKYLNVCSVILIILLTIFILVTVVFFVISVLLLMAVYDENTELMSYYIWLAIVYLCVQFVLAVAIPMILVMVNQYPYAVALMWMTMVMIVGLGWTHFISVVNTYRQRLL